MAETQPGGLYKVGDNYVDAEGKEAKPQAGAPTEEEKKGEGGAEGTETYPYAGVLASGGFATLEAAQNASDDELLAVKGFGPASLKEFRAYKGS